MYNRQDPIRVALVPAGPPPPDEITVTMSQKTAKEIQSILGSINGNGFATTELYAALERLVPWSPRTHIARPSLDGCGGVDVVPLTQTL